MIDLQILGTVPRPGKWNWSFGIWFYRKLSGSPRDKKIKHFAKYKCWNFFKLAHFFSHFSQCNPISNIHPKHTDHCFQFFSNQTWSITNITRMPLKLVEIWQTISHFRSLFQLSRREKEFLSMFQIFKNLIKYYDFF